MEVIIIVGDEKKNTRTILTAMRIKSNILGETFKNETFTNHKTVYRSFSKTSYVITTDGFKIYLYIRTN